MERETVALGFTALVLFYGTKLVSKFADWATRNVKRAETAYYVLGSALTWGILLFGVLMLSSCATAQVKREVFQPAFEPEIRHVNLEEVFPSLKGKNKAAATGCDSLTLLPVIYVDSFWVGKPLYAEILAHEKKHAEDMIQFKSEDVGNGCNGFLYQYNNSKDFKYRAELRADCAVVGFLKPNPLQYEQILVNITNYFYKNQEEFGYRLPEAIAMHVRNTCNEEMHQRK